MTKLHTKDQGTFGEALVVAQILENGHAAFTDFGDNSKTDIIAEDSNGQLHRIQVKTVTRVNECSTLFLRKDGPNYTYHYTIGDVDWFVVVDMETKRIAWVGCDILTECTTRVKLRHTPTKNNQSKGVRMFEDYERYPF